MEWEEASRIARECITKAKEGASFHEKCLGVSDVSGEKLFEAGLAWELAMWVRRHDKEVRDEQREDALWREE